MSTYASQEVLASAELPSVPSATLGPICLRRPGFFQGQSEAPIPSLCPWGAPLSTPHSAPTFFPTLRIGWALDYICFGTMSRGHSKASGCPQVCFISICLSCPTCTMA